MQIYMHRINGNINLIRIRSEGPEALVCKPFGVVSTNPAVLKTGPMSCNVLTLPARSAGISLMYTYT